MPQPCQQVTIQGPTQPLILEAAPGVTVGKNLPAVREMQDMQVRSLGREDPVQEEPRVPRGARPPICSPVPQRNIPELREVRQHPRNTQHTSLSHTSPPLPAWASDLSPSPTQLGAGTRGTELRCWVEEEMAAHSSILAWKISSVEEPGGL